MTTPHRRIALRVSRNLLTAIVLTTLALAIEARFSPVYTLRAAIRGYNPEQVDKLRDMGLILIVAIVAFTGWRWQASRGERVGAVQRQNAYLTALHETTLGLLNRLELTELLETILVQAGALLGTRDGIIIWFKGDDSEAPTRICTGLFRDEARPPVRRDEGLIGIVWETGEPLVLNDYQRWPKRRTGDKRDRIQAAVAVPLLADGQVIGVISLMHLQAERVFSAAEVDLLTRFAHLAAVALDNARLHSQMREGLREREQAEAAVAASERRFQAMVERSTDGIVLFDATNQRTYISPATANVLGYTPEEYRALRRWDLFHPEDVDRIATVLRDIRDKPGETTTVEAQVRHKDGGWRWLSITYTNLLAEPDVRAVIANYRDITERKEAEQALRRHHAYLEALHAVSLGLMRRMELADLLHAILQRAGELLETEHGFVDLVAEDGARLEFIRGHGAFDLTGIKSTERGEGLGGMVWETGRPLLVEDYPTWADRVPGPHTELIRSVVAVPLLSGAEVVGVLGLAHTEAGRTFDDAAIEMLGRFAHLAAIALDNARLSTQMRQELREREQAEAQLRESEERYRHLFDSNPLPMWVYDADSLRFLAVNAAAINHYGYSRAEFLAMTTLDIRPPEEIPALREYLATYTNTYQPSGVWRHRKKDGALVDMEITSYRLDFEGLPARLVVASDVTERQQAEEALRHHALHDALTGLPNRTLFAERLTRALERARRDGGYRFAVLYLDFDRFKNVNDSLGHHYGDQLLVAEARRLTACLRPQDTLARLGGDEFVLLLEEITDRDAATMLADRLHSALAAPVVLYGQEVAITASIGIVVSMAHYKRPEDLLRDADTAMYQAKSLGRARTVVFDTAMHTAAVARLQLENDLRRALDREEFTLLYQPIVTLGTGETIGLEALVRWDHPTRGEIAPAEFIPIAEETGLIVPLDRWVLRTACQQMRCWVGAFPLLDRLTASVNVSGKGIAQPEFVAQVRDILAETGLAPERLKMEITESALIEHAEAVISTLWELRAAGVEVQLDDFGMGYSSLNYVHRLPITGLKIDRSFISGNAAPRVENFGIVQAIVALARHLEIDVTAEGIESVEQQAQLVALACDNGQGFLFAPPLSSEEVEQWLARRTALRMHERENQPMRAAD